MQVGDLVRHIPSSNWGLIGEQHAPRIPGHTALDRVLVKWGDDIGEVEDTSLYAGELEIINASG